MYNINTYKIYMKCYFLMISNYRNVIKLNLRKLAKSLNLIIKLHFSVYIIHITVLHSERASYINDNICIYILWKRFTFHLPSGARKYVYSYIKSTHTHTLNI